MLGYIIVRDCESYDILSPLGFIMTFHNSDFQHAILPTMGNYRRVFVGLTLTLEHYGGLRRWLIVPLRILIGACSASFYMDWRRILFQV